jgi:hypothetical protein
MKISELISFLQRAENMYTDKEVCVSIQETPVFSHVSDGSLRSIFSFPSNDPQQKEILLTLTLAIENTRETQEQPNMQVNLEQEAKQVAEGLSRSLCPFRISLSETIAKASAHQASVIKKAFPFEWGIGLDAYNYRAKQLDTHLNAEQTTQDPPDLAKKIVIENLLDTLTDAITAISYIKLHLDSNTNTAFLSRYISECHPELQSSRNKLGRLATKLWPGNDEAK